MCIVFSLAPDSRDLLGFVRIPIVVETMLFKSVDCRVEISFDFIVENLAEQPAFLNITHADDVQGRLCTEDWFHHPAHENDERKDLVEKIYGDHWKLDRQNRALEFVNPVGHSLSSWDRPQPIYAQALSYPAIKTAHGDFTVSKECLLEFSERLSTYQLRTFPINIRLPENKRRPFSSFRVGPIPPRTKQVQSVFLRLTIVIEGESYRHLVTDPASIGQGVFMIYSSERVSQHIIRNYVTQIKSSGNSDDPFVQFFEEGIAGNVLIPKNYQVIIGQPGMRDPRNMLVRFRSMTSVIQQLYIPNSDARERSLWFDAETADFCIALEYDETLAAGPRSRKDFSSRLAPTLTFLRERDEGK